MTISQMQTAVKQGLDKTSSLELPAFLEEEIDSWINVGIKEFINDLIKIIREPSKSTQENYLKAYDSLRTLLKTSSDIDYIIGTIPSDVYSIIEVYASLNRQLEDGTNSTNDTYKCNLINEAKANKYITNNTHKPYFTYPVYYMSASTTHGFVIISDAFSTVTSFNISYVANPATVELSTSTHCDLPTFTHQKIVDYTVNLLIENIESKRFETNTYVLKNKE